MIVHLLRHAEAEDVSPTGRDADRRLTDAGEKRMRLIARAMANLGLSYDAILVSPLVRSRQTAEVVAETLKFGKPFTETRSLLPAADPGEILHQLATLKPGAALLVGHQPQFGRLFGRLISGRAGLEIPMKKAALAAFETGSDPTAPAELKFYLSPKVLERLA